MEGSVLGRSFPVFCFVLYFTYYSTTRADKSVSYKEAYVAVENGVIDSYCARLLSKVNHKFIF